MLCWRLFGVGSAILLAGTLVSLALSVPAADTAALRLSKGGILRQSQDSPTIAATPIVTVFGVVTHPALQFSPAISSDSVVWADQRNGNWDIYGKRLTTGAEFTVVTNSADQQNPAISGSIVVWEDSRNGNPDIYGKDLRTGVQFPVSTSPYTQTAPTIDGNIVVWTDLRNDPTCDPYVGYCNYDVYGKDLATGVEFPVVTNGASQTNPAISGNVVVWEDWRNGCCDVYGKNLRTGVEFPVTTSEGGQQDPAISDNIVVWVDNRYSSRGEIYGKDLIRGVEFPITADFWSTSYKMRPAISGDIVVWQVCVACRVAASNVVQGKKLSTGDRFAVSIGRFWAYRPAISGNVVVWEDGLSDRDIYGARLNWPLPPGNCSLSGRLRSLSGAYYLEEVGRITAFLYGPVNFAAYLGQQVTVGGPCRVWRESAGPRPVFLAETIVLASGPAKPGPPKASKGAARDW